MSENRSLHFSDYERDEPEGLSGQTFYVAGKSLDVTSWGMNILDMPPLWTNDPKHDHIADGQEEVDILRSGSGELVSGEQCLFLDQGAMARVPPEARHRSRSRVRKA